MVVNWWRRVAVERSKCKYTLASYGRGRVALLVMRADKHLYKRWSSYNKRWFSYTRDDPQLYKRWSWITRGVDWGSPTFDGSTRLPSLEGWPFLSIYWLFLGADAVAKAKGIKALNRHHVLPRVPNYVWDKTHVAACISTPDWHASEE